MMTRVVAFATGLLVAFCCGGLIAQPAAPSLSGFATGSGGVADSGNDAPFFRIRTEPLVFVEGVAHDGYSLGELCIDPEGKPTTVSDGGETPPDTLTVVSEVLDFDHTTAGPAEGTVSVSCTDGVHTIDYQLGYRIDAAVSGELRFELNSGATINVNEGETHRQWFERGDGDDCSDSISVTYTFTGSTAVTDPDTGTLTLGVDECFDFLDFPMGLVSGSNGSVTLTLSNPQNITTPANTVTLGDVTSRVLTIVNVSDPPASMGEFTDTFEDGSIGSDWTTLLGGFTVTNGDAIGTSSATHNIMVLEEAAAIFADDHTVRGTLAVTANGGGVGTRLQTGGCGFRGYFLLQRTTLGDSNRGVYRLDCGDSVNVVKLFTTSDVAAPAGSQPALRSVGDEHCAYVGTTPVGCGTDSTYTTGQPWVRTIGTTVAFEEVYAVDSSEDPEPPPSGFTWDNQAYTAALDQQLFGNATAIDVSTASLISYPAIGAASYICGGQILRLQLNNNTDYVITQASATPLDKPLHVTGGRHVKLKGVHTTLVTQGGTCPAGAGWNFKCTDTIVVNGGICDGNEPPFAFGTSIHPRMVGGMAFRMQQTGYTVFEGVDFDGSGNAGDAVVIRNNALGQWQSRGIVLVNSRFRGWEGHGFRSDLGDSVHGDLLQNQNEGYAVAIFENVSIRSHNESFILQDREGMQPTERYRRVDCSNDTRYDNDDPFEQWALCAVTAHDSVGGAQIEKFYMQWPTGGHYGIFSRPIGSSPTTQRYGSPATCTAPCSGVASHPGVIQGFPPDTENAIDGFFAPAAHVGANYVSPF